MSADPPRPPKHRSTGDKNRAATPIAFVAAILRAYQRYGMDPAACLAAAEIDRQVLDDPRGRITAAQMEQVSESAMRELDDEALGWFRRRLPWGSYGMLCRASLTAPNLGVALRRWCRHHLLLTDDVRLSLAVDGRQARLLIRESADLGAMREFCLVTLLRYVHGYACWAIDSRVPLSQVHFPIAEPAHASVYPLIFPGPAVFDAAQAGFAFDASYLSLPVVRDDAAINSMLKRALPLTVLQYRRDRLLVDRAQKELQARPAEVRDAASLAARLNVSTRTLYRHLNDAGVTLQALKDQAREHRATALLLRTARPVRQIAHEVGFRNEKSFSRAYRQWTGQSPRDVRRSTTTAR